MSVVGEAVAAIKEALKLAEDVKQAAEALKEVSRELREHDRRITRLEAQWETALMFSQRAGPRRLEEKG